MSATTDAKAAPAQRPRLHGYLAANRGDASGAWPGSTGNPATNTARQQIMRTAVHGVALQLAGSGGIVGQYAADKKTPASASTPYPDYDWSNQDRRMAEAAACLPTGGEITLILFGGPFWMMTENNGAGTTPVSNYGTGSGGLNSSTFLDTYVDSSQPGNTTGKGAADFFEYLLSRYLPGGAGSCAGIGYNVTRVIVWQELRGYFSAGGRPANSLVTTSCPSNSWDIWRYALLYNAVWTRLKNSRTYANSAAIREVKIGGPYVVCRGQLDSGVRTGGWSGAVIAANGDSLPGSSNVNGVGWHVDAKVLDVVSRFADLAVGLDFWANDGSQFQTTSNAKQWIVDMVPQTGWPPETAGTRVHFDGSVVLDDREKPRVFGTYVERYFPGIERVWAEAYPSSNNDPAEASIMYEHWHAGGYSQVYLWLGPQSAESLDSTQRQGVGVALWTPAGATPSSSDAITPLGAWAQSITAVAG